MYDSENAVTRKPNAIDRARIGPGQEATGDQHRSDGAEAAWRSHQARARRPDIRTDLAAEGGINTSDANRTTPVTKMNIKLATKFRSLNKAPLTKGGRRVVNT